MTDDKEHQREMLKLAMETAGTIYQQSDEEMVNEYIDAINPDKEQPIHAHSWIIALTMSLLRALHDSMEFPAPRTPKELMMKTNILLTSAITVVVSDVKE